MGENPGGRDERGERDGDRCGELGDERGDELGDELGERSASKSAAVNPASNATANAAANAAAFLTAVGVHHRFSTLCSRVTDPERTSEPQYAVIGSVEIDTTGYQFTTYPVFQSLADLQSCSNLHCRLLRLLDANDLRYGRL